MAVLEPDNNEPPSFLRGSGIDLMAGATFTQARDHVLLCQYVDSLTLTQMAELKEVTKQLSALYINTKITVAQIAKQDFGFPTNMDGV